MPDIVFQRCNQPRLLGHVCGRGDAFSLPALVAIYWTWLMIGIVSRRPKSLRDFEVKWADRSNPLSFQRRLAISRVAAVRPSGHRS